MIDIQGTIYKRFARVTEINMMIRCSRRIRAYSMDQLRAHSICFTSEGDTIGACNARMRNG